MRRIVLILLMIWGLGLGSCKKENDYFLMEMIETGCANPWDKFYTNETEDTKIIQQYLASINIHAKRVYFFTYNTGVTCLSCFCPTGRKVIIKVLSSDINKAEKIGFYLSMSGENNAP